jgi:hypothetical protein
LFTIVTFTVFPSQRNNFDPMVRTQNHFSLMAQIDARTTGRTPDPD